LQKGNSSRADFSPFPEITIESEAWLAPSATALRGLEKSDFTFGQRFFEAGLLPVVVMVMPIMTVMMMAILYPHHDLGLRCDGCDKAEEEQSEQKDFHNIFYQLL
jgi:hypothetical protein